MRSYYLTALQNYAKRPYRLLLQTIHGEIPEQSINCIRRRLRSPSVRNPSAPPGVSTSSHDFLRHRIARHSSGLQRQQSVCLVFSTLSAAHWRRAQSKVSGPEIPVSKVAVCRVPSAPDFERRSGVRTSALDPRRVDDQRPNAPLSTKRFALAKPILRRRRQPRPPFPATWS